MEKDWKLFRKKLGSWQEAYMDKLVEEYKSILNSDALSSDKYWALRKKIYEDYKKSWRFGKRCISIKYVHYIIRFIA